MSRHRDLLLGCQSILCTPQTGDGLPLGVEAQAVLAVEVGQAGSGDTLLVAGEAEHRQRDGDGHVDADLAGLKFLLEQRRSRAGPGEDGRAVAVGVGVDEVNGLFGGVDIQADEDGAEDLFGVALHVRLDVGDDGWSDLEQTDQLADSI